MTALSELSTDVLRRVLAYCDVPSLGHFLCTCRAFRTVSFEETLPIVRAQVAYDLKQYVVHVVYAAPATDSFPGHADCRGLEQLLAQAQREAVVTHLRSAKVMLETWERGGPVAAQLLQWLVDFSEDKDEGNLRATTYETTRSVTLRLPRRAADLAISSRHFGDYGHNYDTELSIAARLGGRELVAEGFSSSWPERWAYFDDAELAGAAGPFGAVFEALEDELEDLSVGMNPHFWFWLCFFFPDRPEVLGEAWRPRFRDEARNARPPERRTPARPPAAPLRPPFDAACAEWLPQAAAAVPDLPGTIVAGLWRLVGHAGAACVLAVMMEDVQRWRDITMALHQAVWLSQASAREWLWRTRLGVNGFTPGAVANKYVRNQFWFRGPDGAEISVEGGMRGDGASYPTWEALRLKWGLPDGRVVALKRGRTGMRNEGEGGLAVLTPVAALISEWCPGAVLGRCNEFVLGYTMHALAFDGQLETFFGEGVWWHEGRWSAEADFPEAGGCFGWQ